MYKHSSTALNETVMSNVFSSKNPELVLFYEFLGKQQYFELKLIFGYVFTNIRMIVRTRHF